MELNSNNFVDLDEQERQQEDEKQTKEIQALLMNELGGIELEEYDDEDDNNSLDNFKTERNMTLSKSLDEDNMVYEIESSHNDSNDKENNYFQPFHLMNNFIPNWSVNPYSQFYNVMPSNNKQNFQYKFLSTNNNSNGTNDSSINWDISLHGEMGIPVSEGCHPIFQDKHTFLASSNPEKEKPKKVLKITTRDVAVECIPATQRELDNLELLYCARGKRIEQLQIELESEREKRIKETRIANHKITLLESEMKNESNQLKRINEEREQQMQTISANDEVISKQNDKILNLESDIGKLKDNLESCKIVIEGLNEQLSDLTCSTAMSRNNQKQADLLDCINRQFDTDSYRLKAEIQRISERLDEKMKEIEKLEALLDEQTDNHRIQKNEWKLERERFLEDLANEKEHLKEIVNSTSQEKIDQLNNQICDLDLGKSLVEDMNDYLQQQVVEFSHQLAAYEQSLNLLDQSHTVDNSFYHEENPESQKHMPNIHASCPILPIVRNGIETQNHGFKNIIFNNSCEMRKQIFVLIARTTSLTNRLLDVRKANLDAKGQLKKLQRTVDEQNGTNSTLQTKLSEMEKRMKEIQSGEETSLEKQLKASVESIEVMKDYLEQECKVLQNQLKQATESMKMQDRNYHQLDEDFSLYKQMAEEDKMACVENVKSVCNNHYENLRLQLEQSWMAEKEQLMDEEKCHREKLMQDLSDALKEIDRVKNLYVQLSQQRSDENLDRDSWHDWLAKKLDEQKRSLNQQFKRDQEIILYNLESSHQLEIENLRGEMENRLVRQEDKCEGTYSPVMIDELCESDLVDSKDKSIQVESIIDDMETLKILRVTNDHLTSQLEIYQEERIKMQDKYDSLNNIKLSIEQENMSLISQINTGKPSLSIPLDNQYSTPSRVTGHQGSIPSIIRSTTPQLVFPTKRKNGIQLETIHKSNIEKQFRALKEDLIAQLSEISHSMQLDNKNSVDCQPQYAFHPSDISPSGMAIEKMKEHLYSFVLEAQIRAASTLQHELEKSQIFVRHSLLEQLRQVIPVILSVDGHMMNITPGKIKKLADKIILMLDHLEVVPPSNGIYHSTTNTQSRPMHPFSFTSTPINHPSQSHKLFNMPPNLTNVSLNTSNDSWNSTISQQSQPKLKNAIDNQCKILKDEIAQLSDALNKTNSHSIASINRSSFDNVERTWFSSTSDIDLSSDYRMGTNYL